MDDYYRRYNANVHRGVHYLRRGRKQLARFVNPAQKEYGKQREKVGPGPFQDRLYLYFALTSPPPPTPTPPRSMLATEEYEKAREKVARFINTAQGPSEIVFTRNASEAINLVAYSWGLSNLSPGDEVLLTVAEHHSNIVPWQIVAQKTGAVLKFAPLKVPEEAEREGHAAGAEVDYERLLEMIGARTKLVAVHHVSNVLGSESPVEQIRERAHAVGAKVLLDACQSVPHMPVDVQQLGVDFAAVSSHKMAGPTGIGFLYGRSDVLASMPPFMAVSSHKMAGPTGIGFLYGRADVLASMPPFMQLGVDFAAVSSHKMAGPTGIGFLYGRADQLGVDFAAVSSHKMAGPTGIGFLYGRADVLASMPPFMAVSSHKMAGPTGIGFLYSRADVLASMPPFMAVSSHKMAGPTGIGFLYGRSEVLASMPPFMGRHVPSRVSASLHDMSVQGFEAGTPAIAEAIGLGAAVDYLTAKGMDNVHAYEMHLSEYLYKQLSAVDRVRIYGPPPPSLLPGGPTAIQRGRVAALCTFSVDGMHATDGRSAALHTFSVDGMHATDVPPSWINRCGHGMCSPSLPTAPLPPPPLPLCPPPSFPPSPLSRCLLSFPIVAIFNIERLLAVGTTHGVGIRSGHHCAQPIHQQLGINASARASAYVYNTKEEIDAFIVGLKDTIDFFVNFS
ncbi:unnamed protein product [Closterium sp. NIES-64]|nr:unnamed protein product [Closterium sp. NIES-64]